MATPEVELFNSIIDHPEFTLAYKDSRSFNIHSLNATDRTALAGVAGIELRFGIREFDVFAAGQCVHRIQDALGFSSNLFFRDVALPVSPLRSYKRILKGNRLVAPSCFFEKEYISANGTSYFGALATIDGFNFDTFTRFFFNTSLNFIVMTSGALDLTEQNLDEVMKGNDYFQGDEINYARLIVRKCAIEKSIVVRGGGDGGSTYSSAQYFLPIEFLRDFETQLQNAVETIKNV